ncbi:MAG: GYD domain-containing protein [Acidobacteria bacterium]|nr:GYD domain-containing protein [Acidobacteriota bacterium]
MPKYLIQFRYTQAGTKGVLKDGGTKRRAVVKKGIESVGGKMESFHFTFGEYDGVVVADMPNAAAAAALSLQVSASGTASLRTTALLEPEEIDAAARKKVTYRAAGK